MGETLRTPQTPYKLLRGTVSSGSADGDLTAATKTWATFVSTYHPISGSSPIAAELSEYDNRITIIFDFENVDADTAAVIIYLYKKGGPAEFVCDIATLTAGAQESDLVEGGKLSDASVTNRFFCDKFTTLTQRWPTTVGQTEHEENNGVAKLTFDTRGYKYILCLFTAISSNDSVRAWFSGH